MSQVAFVRGATWLTISLFVVSISLLANSSWTQSSRDSTSGPERHSSRLVGLRRIQRRPELIDPRDDDDDDDRSSKQDENFEQSNILIRAARELLPSSYVNRRMYDKRSSNKLTEIATSASPQAVSNEFFYVIAPISEQALPFQRSKVDQGYKNFVNLAGPNYKTGLQRLTADSDLVSAGDEDSSSASGLVGSTGCRATKSKIALTRDEFDQTTGQLLRQCAGLAELNSCEGECVSSIQPSVKAPGGFMKKCSCCNEGSFRQVQVRLHECWLPMGLNQGTIGPRLPAGQMDILVDEPAECRCRPCDTLI